MDCQSLEISKRYDTLPGNLETKQCLAGGNQSPSWRPTFLLGVEQGSEAVASVVHLSTEDFKLACQSQYGVSAAW